MLKFRKCKNPYRKGVTKERYIVRTAKMQGKIALRSAASKSPIDVVIIDKDNNLIELIQCKAGLFSDRERIKLEEKYEWLNGLWNVEFSVR